MRAGELVWSEESEFSEDMATELRSERLVRVYWGSQRNVSVSDLGNTKFRDLWLKLGWGWGGSGER